MFRHSFLPLPLSAALLAAAVVLAAALAHADDDRFLLRIGGMHAKAESQLQAQAEFLGDSYDFQSERYEIGEKTVPRIEGMARLGNRHRLLFNYFQYSEGNRATLGDDVTFDDTTFPGDSFVDLETKFALGSLVYDFAVVETPNASVGLQIGAEWARLEGTLRAESGDDGKWRAVAQGQYLDADWGDFDDYEDDITRANALVEYRFTPRVGVYAGYDWFKLDVRQVGSDGVIGLDQRFSGPIAGVTFAF